MSLFEPKTPGIELLQKELNELEQLGSLSMPSLNSFLNKHNLFMTKADYKELKKIMVENKKWKICPVYDYEIVRRGRKKK